MYKMYSLAPFIYSSPILFSAPEGVSLQSLDINLPIRLVITKNLILFYVRVTINSM